MEVGRLDSAALGGLAREQLNTTAGQGSGVPQVHPFVVKISLG